MRKIFLLQAMLVLALFSKGQSVPYNVVFDITTKDTSVQKSLIRWLQGISASNADAKLEVVLYGSSLDMVVKDKSVVADAVQQLSQNKNITFKVCAAAMKRHNLKENELLPRVTLVPDGVYQIVIRQKEGWGYIKAAN